MHGANVHPGMRPGGVAGAEAKSVTIQEVSTASQQAGADDADRLAKETGAPVPHKRQRGAPWPVHFWRSAIGKKWVMAVTGIMLLGFVLVHMIGNLKVFLSAGEVDQYGEWLRTILEPALPRTVFLWILRVGLIGAFFLHITSAYQLTRMNHAARPVKYKGGRTYVAADFASRTMRWTGIIIGLFLVYHLADLTWGTLNPHFVRGAPYENMVQSFNKWYIAAIYIVANIALGIHIFHGAWAMFHSLGLNNPSYNRARRYFATGFAALITVGNVSIPIAVLTGAVS